MPSLAYRKRFTRRVIGGTLLVFGALALLAEAGLMCSSYQHAQTYRRRHERLEQVRRNRAAHPPAAGP